ncbi:putative metal-dependent peptidase [Actinoalloteichus hoggarensis]|uniref:Uncharacterized protein n=1 Tax=Actinoalloteichus hoggarensis TaxID=1470176 RepID=A0A221W354_9PSEU|nr:VWA-like domain-containing protein [Actinoalloteichus hoggarensis]ASO20156.1 hypothetical protein AHOG_12565 [Actinoalloteichus hoggarensis]MBB5919131.1 putative metal-dependent peptidase [Actinoalloteichus hoggarensis]
MSGEASADTAAADQVLARFSSARLWAAHHAPYLAGAVFALHPVVLPPLLDESTSSPVPDPEFRAFPVDTRWRVYLETGTALATPVPEIGWWLLHHIGHLVRAHAARSPVRADPAAAGDTEARRWNQAADAEINDDLAADGLPAPDGVISPAELGLPPHLTAEEYLPLLDVLADAVGRGGREAAELVDCGSAADGVPRDRELPESGGGPDELERELLERSLAAGIQDRVSVGSAVPLGWRRWAEARLAPKVNWRARLAALIRRGHELTGGRVDFSRRRPSRRAAACPEIVPAATVRPVPGVVVVVDTSGSVTSDRLRRLIGEVDAILHGIGGSGRRLRVLCCDAVPHPVQVITRAEDVVLLGGGGTDMRAGIAEATTLRPRPDLIIVLTDGETPWPDRRPAVPLLVCLIGEDGAAPDWAHTVRIPEEQT